MSPGGRLGCGLEAQCVSCWGMKEKYWRGGEWGCKEKL